VFFAHATPPSNRARVAKRIDEESGIWKLRGKWY
jgi:hypothetical protein